MAEAVRRLTRLARLCQPLLPAALLTVFAFFCGTFDAVSSTAAIVRAASLLGMAGVAVFAGRHAWTDALRLGRGGRWLPLALYGVALASCWTSPVPRAGWTVLLLLPALYLLPVAVAWCWRTEQARRWGLPAVTVVAVTVAVVSLVGVARGDLRAAEPLGQHILLAAFLVTLWPLALVGVFQLEASAPLWIVAGTAALLGVATTVAVVKSGSLLATLGFVLQVFVAWTWRSRSGHPLGTQIGRRSRRRWLPTLVALVLVGGALAVLFGLRLLDVATLEDNSLRARLGYWQACVRGVEARPMLGWGPGATPWTLAEHLHPDPGVRPAGEVVGDLHGLPQQLAYELGFPGLLLVLGIGGAWWWRRRAEELCRAEEKGRAIQVAGVDGMLAPCARLGLVGFGICALGSGLLMASALPVALLVVLGAGLAVRQEAGEQEVAQPVPARWPAVLALVLTAAGSTPLWIAHAHYDRAVAAQSKAQRAEHLRRAVELDPRFPLYRARLAGLEEEPTTAARQAQRAAEHAHAVAPLWLLAGQAAMEIDVEDARAALLRALELDPFSPPAPWLLLQLDPRPRNAEMGARAVLAEPRLAGARWWARHPRLWPHVREAVRTWPGLDPGWRDAFLDATAELEWSVAGPVMALDADAKGDVGISSLLFRRQPWSWRVWMLELGEVPETL